MEDTLLPTRTNLGQHIFTTDQERCTCTKLQDSSFISKHESVMGESCFICSYKQSRVGAEDTGGGVSEDMPPVASWYAK